MSKDSLNEADVKKKLLVLPSDLFNRIENQAKKESRSTASLIRWAIIKYLEENE